jgi:predicted permease
MPLPPAQVARQTPAEPRREKYMLVTRVRQAVSFAAFAVSATLPAVWVMSSSASARRHRRLMAEVMLGLALLGTIGMMLGWGHLANWKNFRIGSDAAGYGLVLVPLGVVAVLVASRGGDVDDVDDVDGGSKM